MAAVDVDVVVARLHARGGVAVQPEQAVIQSGRHRAAGGVAVLVLLLLVAVYGIVQEVGEVVPQRLFAVDIVEVAGEMPVCALRRVVARHAQPLVLGAIGRVERPVAVDQTLLYGALGLVGREVADPMVVERRKVVAVREYAMAVSQRAGVLLVVVGVGERPIHVAEVEGAQQPVVRAQGLGPAHKRLVVVQRAAGEHDLVGDHVGHVHVVRGHRPEIPDRRVIGPLGVVEPVGELRDDEVQVRIALAMGVGRTVDRHVVEEVGDVGAVVQVESPRQVLVGLALAGVDGDHQPRYGLQ